ncbi:MAG: glycosyltransferase family 2 protein [Moorea sp. SIO3F7]|nr:glycosyltransferase family 2 protein [Moorena sp. SIO3E8]NEP98030.1 glycosyltransferase family 2 protein [Moorena sp. SIO3F7]
MALIMNNKSLVSTIIIFLNPEPFIQETIESVFAQTYDNWELLLVDDGSTDGSTEIALQYARKYPEKVRYLEHEGHQNRGMSATRNLGIRHAKGEYIAFLDADDIWLPNTLAEQVVLLNAHPEAAMVYGPIQWWYSWTGNPEDQQRDYFEKVGVQTDTLINPPTLFLLLLQRRISISGMLLRRQIVEDVGGFEENFRGLYEDQVFCSKICLHAPVFPVSNCWYKYRQHPNNCCSIAEKTGKEYIARLFYLNWVGQYLSEHKIKDIKVWYVFIKELLLASNSTVYYWSSKSMYLKWKIKQRLLSILKTFSKFSELRSLILSINGK